MEYKYADFRLSDYEDKPWELENVPDEVFEYFGLDKVRTIAGIRGTYESKINAYKPVEASDPAGSAKTFWRNWEQFKCNKTNFHKAFDAELAAIPNALWVFDKEGNFKDRKVYAHVNAIYTSHPSSDAARALFKYWQYIYDKENLGLSAEETLKSRTADVQAELDAFGVESEWDIKGKLVAVFNDRAEFEYDDPDEFTTVTTFFGNFGGFTAKEVAKSIIELYALGQYNSQKLLDE